MGFSQPTFFDILHFIDKVNWVIANSRTQSFTLEKDCVCVEIPFSGTPPFWRVGEIVFFYVQSFCAYEISPRFNAKRAKQDFTNEP